MMSEEEIRRFLANLDQETSAVSKVQFPVLDAGPLPAMPVKTAVSFLEEVKVNLVAELGETTMKTRDILGLKEGAVIELNRSAGEAIDLIINNQKFARGEVLVLNEIFAVRISAIHSPRNPQTGSVGNG
jgi:flagellar motor switch protein FliN/FliY